MILLCGIPSETPLARVQARLEARGIPHLLFNQRAFADLHLSYTIGGSGDAQGLHGSLQVGARTYPLQDVQGVYIRLMDDQALPELAHEPLGSALRQHCRRVHDALVHWSEITPARVVNRARAMGSNSSKPYQAQRICRWGFLVPETLITDQAADVQEFWARHQGEVVYKSISGVRSIVQRLSEADFSRLTLLRVCPVQFQQFVTGTNIRVHVVGREVFATAIDSDTTDYRYARQQGGSTQLRAVQLTDEWAERCIALAADLGLGFAGIDLKVTPEGAVYCFEVNPSPAYSYYEAHTQQPIADAVARYLSEDA